jgi:hypothetical protein
VPFGGCKKSPRTFNQRYYIFDPYSVFLHFFTSPGDVYVNITTFQIKTTFSYLNSETKRFILAAVFGKLSSGFTILSCRYFKSLLERLFTFHSN